MLTMLITRLKPPMVSLSLQDHSKQARVKIITLHVLAILNDAAMNIGGPCVLRNYGFLGAYAL